MKTESSLFLAAGLIAACLLVVALITPVCVAGCAGKSCIEIAACAVPPAGVGSPCMETGNNGATPPVYIGVCHSLGYADTGYGSVAKGGAPGTFLTGQHYTGTCTVDCDPPPIGARSSGSTLTVAVPGLSYRDATKCVGGGSGG